MLSQGLTRILGMELVEMTISTNHRSKIWVSRVENTGCILDLLDMLDTVDLLTFRVFKFSKMSDFGTFREV